MHDFHQYEKEYKNDYQERHEVELLYPVYVQLDNEPKIVKKFNKKGPFRILVRNNCKYAAIPIFGENYYLFLPIISQYKI